MFYKIYFFFPLSDLQTTTNSSNSGLDSIQVRPDELEMFETEILGFGTFSEVFKGKLLGLDVAIKSFKDSGQDKVKLFLTKQTKLQPNLT